MRKRIEIFLQMLCFNSLQLSFAERQRFDAINNMRVDKDVPLLPQPDSQTAGALSKRKAYFIVISKGLLPSYQMDGHTSYRTYHFIKRVIFNFFSFR